MPPRSEPRADKSAEAARTSTFTTVDKPTDSITPYARNPRQNANAVAAVAASIKEFGFRQPIVVDKHGVIIVGHTRHLAAIALGLPTVPVHVAETLTPAQVKALRIADNRVGENATWMEDLLHLEMADLKLDGFNLDLTGFNGTELDHILSGGSWDSDLMVGKPNNVEEADAGVKVTVYCAATDVDEVRTLVSEVMLRLGDRVKVV